MLEKRAKFCDFPRKLSKARFLCYYLTWGSWINPARLQNIIESGAAEEEWLNKAHKKPDKLTVKTSENRSE
jgi:hypothetical protein